MKEKLKAWWDKLAPEQKRKAVIGGGVGVIVLFILIAGESSERPQAVRGAKTQVRTISLEDDVLKKSIFAVTNEKLERERKRSERELSQAKEEIDGLKNSLAELRKGLIQGNYPDPALGPGQGPLNRPQTGAGKQTPPPVRFTPNPNAKVPQPNRPDRPSNRGPIRVEPKTGEPQQPRGGIGSVEAPPPPPKPKKPAKASRNYLPVSIVKATTLTGIHATVSEEGMANPQPVILRISKPAILPNRIRKDIVGCFVIAEGYGSLATERVELRTRTISCLSREGRAVIEEPIKGFVVDGDGNLGLAGRVVARFGSVLARTALAGFFEGVGELTADSTQVTTTDPLTGERSQQIGTQDIAKGALGKGLQKATGEIGKFYLSLAKQSLPVVEILPGKKVDIVVSEGVALKLNES